MIVLVACVSLLLSVSQGDFINNVVRFICKGCMPKSNECCVGTIISSHYIVTSNYCAEMCQLVKINKNTYFINKYYIYPYAKTFAMGDNIIGSNAIALVKIDLKLKKGTSFIKLSSVDIKSLIGLEAIIPDAKTNRVAEIKQCKEDLSHLMEYYVCAGEKQFEDCYIRQGTPLILNNTLLGVMGIQDSNNCEYSQRSFLAIKPMTYWINYTLDGNSYNQSKRLLFSLNYGRRYVMTVPKKTSTNSYNAKIFSKKKTVSIKATSKPKIKSTYSNKKKQMMSTKKYITPIKKHKSMPRINISNKNMKQGKSNKTTTKNNNKSIKISKKAISKRKISTAKYKANKNWKNGIPKSLKPKSPIKSIRKKKGCSRIISEITIIKKTTKKLKTKPKKTKHYTLPAKSITYKHKKYSSPKTKIYNKHNIKRSKANNKTMYLKNPSPATERKYPDKTTVKQSFKTTTFVTTTIKSKGSSPPFFNFIPDWLNLNKVSLILTKNYETTTVKMNQVTNLTNALDWFKNAFKNMSKDPTPILVLNESTMRTEFVDLT